MLVGSDANNGNARIAEDHDTMNCASEKNRGQYTVTNLGSLENKEQFWLQSADALMEGMRQEQKFIPIEFVYDDLGSLLFDEMVDSEEYYLPHKEREILKESGPRIVELTKECDIYELGSGSARKTGILLRCFRNAGCSFTFYPIDINQSIMEKGAAELIGIIPDISINCMVGTFEQALRDMNARGRTRLVLFIGSSISQLDNDDLLHLLHSVLEPGEFVLVGYDLLKGPDILKSAYQNRQAAVANKNALTCINNLFDGNFDLESFEFVVVYNSAERRCETHLRSLADHTACLKRIGLKLEFRTGETIRTGCQRKFTIDDMHLRFARAGFGDMETFTDDQGWYAMTLFRAEPA